MGKKTILFSTNAGYGEGNSVTKIQELAPKVTILKSFSIQDEDVLESKETVIGFLQRVK